ncbi:MAG TPA: O-antigen ligase family protein, partial [Vicinamibacteria bacterium]|nr:O-antigen ligase family protein [Vicinamibacteria bacterium]
GGDLRPLWLATALALALVGAVGLAQLAGSDPLAALSAGDHRGSTFGNANMAAQFAGLAAVLLLAAAPPARRLRRGTGALLAALAACCWIVGLGTRSVLLALAAGVAAAALASPLRARVRPALVLGLALALSAVAWWTAARVLGPEGRAHKAQSLQDRLYVWADTVRLVAENPLGVGAGGFEDAYRPYQASGRGFVDELQVFRQPHNEYLRVAAEEGLPLLVLAAALLARLAWAVARGSAPAAPGRELVAGWSIFLAVEAFFQFPLALAFPSACAAVLVGLGLWHAEGAPARAGSSRAARLAAGTAAVALLLGTTRVALSERLFVSARNDLAAQQRACRLDPRNLPSCVMAAWLRGAAGDLPGARADLAAVLERAPHYPPAVKLLAQQALVAGDREAACVYMAAYEALFRGRSSLHADFMQACDEEARRGGRARVPSPHYERFPLAGGDG